MQPAKPIVSETSSDERSKSVLDMALVFVCEISEVHLHGATDAHVVAHLVAAVKRHVGDRCDDAAFVPSSTSGDSSLATWRTISKSASAIRPQVVPVTAPSNAVGHIDARGIASVRATVADVIAIDRHLAVRRR